MVPLIPLTVLTFLFLLFSLHFHTILSNKSVPIQLNGRLVNLNANIFVATHSSSNKRKVKMLDILTGGVMR